MTQHRYRSMALLALLVSCVVVHADSPTTREHTGNDSISISDFGRGNVIGHLGHPLGAIVRVTGICIDGNTTRRRDDEGKSLLTILTVNGKSLKQPFTVPFIRAAKDITKPTHGELFDYFAHEWGNFDGVVHVPDGLGVDQPNIANDGFYYRPQITIHKANPVAKHTPIQQPSGTTP